MRFAFLSRFRQVAYRRHCLWLGWFKIGTNESHHTVYILFSSLKVQKPITKSNLWRHKKLVFSLNFNLRCPSRHSHNAPTSSYSSPGPLQLAVSGRRKTGKAPEIAWRSGKVSDNASWSAQPQHLQQNDIIIIQSTARPKVLYLPAPYLPWALRRRALEMQSVTLPAKEMRENESACHFQLCMLWRKAASDANEDALKPQIFARHNLKELGVAVWNGRKNQKLLHQTLGHQNWSLGSKRGKKEKKMTAICCCCCFCCC